MPLCYFKDCHEPIHGRGLCNTHYMRIHREEKREHYRNYERKQRLQNPDKQRESSRKSYCKNIEESRMKNRLKIKKLRKEKPELIKEMSRKSKTKRRKEIPEMFLKNQIKHLEKYGKLLNLKTYEFSWALNYWSKSVKKRDGNKCVNCGSTKDLHADHIIPKSKRPDLALDIDNGRTLCRECHYKRHWG